MSRGLSSLSHNATGQRQQRLNVREGIAQRGLSRSLNSSGCARSFRGSSLPSLLSARVPYRADRRNKREGAVRGNADSSKSHARLVNALLDGFIFHDVSIDETAVQSKRRSVYRWQSMQHGCSRA